MKIGALLTSRNQHYCTPPVAVRPMCRTLIPPGSGRTLFDGATNSASIIPATMIADGEQADGKTCRWSDCDTFYLNPDYATIEEWVPRLDYWGREVGMPGIALVPARDDTVWMQGGTKGGTRIPGIFESADAWLYVKGRLTFWVPIPIQKKHAPAVDSGERYYLQRWYKDATIDNLPEPFRKLDKRTAIGPELGANGRPQSAPFPSIIPFWADKVGRYGLREEGAEYPIDVREFARWFLPLGTLVVPRGPLAGVWQR
jgi:hypothetical protein